MTNHLFSLAIVILLWTAQLYAQDDFETRGFIKNCKTHLGQSSNNSVTRFEIIDKGFTVPQQNIYLRIPINKTKEATENTSFYLGHGHFLFKDLDTVTFLKTTNANPLVVDFYLHGKDNQIAIAVKNLDLNKFFFKPLHLKKDQPGYCMKKVQYFFEELNRKEKIFCRLNKEPPGQLTARNLSGGIVPLYNPIAFTLTNNCREPGHFELKVLSEQNQRLFKAHIMFPLDVYDEILKIHSGGMGLAEIKSGHRSTQFYRDLYSSRQTHVDKIKEAGTFLEKFKAMIASWWSKDATKEEVGYLWELMPNFDSLADECKLSELDHIIDRPQEVFSKGEIEIVKGPIDMNEYLAETVFKTAITRPDTEPLVYVKTPCNDYEATRLLKLGPPHGFRGPIFYMSRSNPKQYWDSKPCTLIPHAFTLYEEIPLYDIHLSSFEIDGVYNGSSRSVAHVNRALTDERLRWDFEAEKIVPHYKKYEIRKKGRIIEITLLSDVDKDITVSNLSLDELQAEEGKNNKIRGIYSLFGFDAMPLSADYNENWGREKPLVVFMHQRNGTLINHHLKRVGIEQVFIRKRGCSLMVDLVSHERIQPLWRGVLSKDCKLFADL